MPVSYWVLGAQLRQQTPAAETFTVKLARIDGEKPGIGTEEQAAAALADLEGRALRVNSINTRAVSRRPLPPFITSTLQQAASSVLGYSPSRTMSIAQKLYEGIDLGEGNTVGLITYMRTDAPTVARDAERPLIIRSEYGDDHCPTSPTSTERSGAQEPTRPYAYRCRSRRIS